MLLLTVSELFRPTGSLGAALDSSNCMPTTSAEMLPDAALRAVT
jgi:hypothetical protein